MCGAAFHAGKSEAWHVTHARALRSPDHSASAAPPMMSAASADSRCAAGSPWHEAQNRSSRAATEACGPEANAAVWSS